SMDVRHPEDNLREEAVEEIHKRANEIAGTRSLQQEWKLVSQTPAVVCDKNLSSILSQAVERQQQRTLLLPSGAGHDAAAMAAVAPVAMLFVRSKGGISHHPDEFTSIEDIGVAIAVLDDVLQTLREVHPRD